MKITIATIMILSIVGCGGGSSSTSSSFDISDNAPIIEEGNSTNVSNPNYFKIEGKVNEEIFTLKATDKSDITYYLTGQDAVSFYIDPIIGKVFFRGRKEYENKFSFHITVVVKDALGNVTHKDYKIDIIGGGIHVNDTTPPLISTSAEYNINDNFFGNKFQIEGTDRNPIHFALEDKSSKFLLIQQDKRAIISLANSPIDKDFISTLNVSATDIYGNKSSQKIKVNVEKTTTAQPLIKFYSANEVTVKENSLMKFLIKANVKANNPDNFNRPTYYFFGEDAKYFKFEYELEDPTDPFSNVAKTYIGLKVPADYESKNTYNFLLTIQKDEENIASQHITVKVVDKDEKKKDSKKPIFLSEKKQQVYQDFYSDRKYLASAIASDDNKIKYALKKGEDADHLVINPSSGIIYVADHMWGNTKNNFNFTVIATDTQGNESTQNIEVERYNVIISPYIAPRYHNIKTDGHIEVASGASQIVTTLQTTTKPESFQFEDELDNDDFTLDAKTGLLKFRNIPNYFIKSFYKININHKIMFITVRKP